MPSIRQTSRDHQLSISTVIEAFRILEDQGLIESRPRSGYFVAPPRLRSGRELSMPVSQVPETGEVAAESILETVLNSAKNRNFISMAGAVPDESIIPAAKLAVIAQQLMRRSASEAFAYTPPTGTRDLRAALSRHLMSAGLKVTPVEVIVTSGATEALSLALQVSTKPGDLVAVESPTYFGLLQLIRELGRRVVEIPVCPCDGFSVEGLETAMAAHAIKACVVQPNFHNPLGCVMSVERKKRLVELSEKHGFALIEDDAYGDLSHEGERPPSLGLYGKDVIHCGSVSKTIAPGLRVGWILPGKYFQEVKRVKAALFPWNPAISELTVAGFLKGGGYQRHLRKIRQRYAERCRRMREAVIACFPESVRVSQPQGGFVLWLEMPEGFDAGAFALDAVGEGISVVPGPFFSASGRFQHCLRLSCGFAFERKTLRALQVLGSLAKRRCR
jgi:DNA-binding transcriptional MocR family regulator